MHIELTDHLRCPADHDEAFLVLLPGQMNGRRVVAGHLGCPICGWTTAWTDAVPVFGSAPAPQGQVTFDAATALTLLGLEGPGGWLALAGRAGALAAGIGALLPGVAIVAVNPPDTVQPDDRVSVLRAAKWPIKRHAMRGVVFGGDAGFAPTDAVASVLPGLRAVGEGELPSLRGDQELLAESAGVWVAKSG